MASSEILRVVVRKALRSSLKLTNNSPNLTEETEAQ